MAEFTYSEEDPVGEQTLELIAAAHRFNRWMYQRISRYVQAGTVLEIGSGIGNISQFFLDAGYKMTLSDIRKGYCSTLSKKFGAYTNLQGVEEIDLIDPLFEQKHAKLLGTFDNVYALNVVEHIEEDALAIQNCRKLMKPDGVLIILVPAYPALYNQMDKELGHYRRYTQKTLKHLIAGQDFKLLTSFYFNLAGIPGWYVNGKVMKEETINGGLMRLYNRLVPLFKFTDWVTMRQAGLSVVVVGRKK